MGLLSRLSSAVSGAVSRGLGRVAEALGFTPREAPPEPPARAAPPERVAPTPAPRPSPVVVVEAAPLPPPPRIELAAPSPAEVLRWRIEASDAAGAVWAAQRGPLEGPALAELRELKALDTRTGEPFLGRGHPDLLEPLELLERYGGRSEEQALVELADLASDDLASAAQLEALRAEARAEFAAALEAARLEAREAAWGPPPEPLAVPELAPLQGAQITSSGDLEESVRDVWGRWVVSSLAGMKDPPVMVIEVDGVKYHIPPEIMREGPAAILDLIGEMRQEARANWYQNKGGSASIGGFDVKKYPKGKGK